MAGRLGKTLLELGGNNSIIVTENADLELTTHAIVFGAVGTAGQRCTTTGRLIVHKDIAPQLTKRLIKDYGQIPMGDSLEEGILLGPLINGQSVENMVNAVGRAKADGGELLAGGKPRPGIRPNFVEPTLIKIPTQSEIVKEETFAPILYLMEYESLDDAIALHKGCAARVVKCRLYQQLVSSRTIFIGTWL